jgi:hypothetical protein
MAVDEPRGPCERIDAPSAMFSTELHADDFRGPAQLLRRAGVGAIVLVHGTFAGNDIAGLVRELARFSPASARKLRQLSKRWVDELIGEAGNFTQSFADCLSHWINSGVNPHHESGEHLRPDAATGDEVPIPVHRFHWSGENHHLGRADGVMSLIERIEGIAGSEDRVQRVLILAHSHGGNVLAMLSQIVGADPATIDEFFQATRPHYVCPVRDQVDLTAWQRVMDRLHRSNRFPALDVVTLGTPLRYRWNRRVCPKLLHLVQHRPLDPAHPDRALMPGSLKQITDAAAGDYIQHIGIAGTDFPPSIVAWRDWIVERRMHGMFESGMRRRDVWAKLKQGRRESSDGTTLLVDYSANDNPWYRLLFGHGVYTCRQWLPFHLREITQRFYGDSVYGDSVYGNTE